LSPLQTPRHVAVCADDFGADEAASQAIIELGASQAISAASCLVNAPFCLPLAGALQSKAPRLSLGLHFDLTDYPSLALRAGLAKWLLRGILLRNIDAAAIHAEFSRQLRQFEFLFGAPPDFIDGHRHVHQIPGIREILVAEVFRRYGSRVAVRSTCALRARGPKARLIQSLGGLGLRSLLQRTGLPTNADFAGVYDFSQTPPYAARMAAWIAGIADGGLIMCHPQITRVPFAARNAREAEYVYLSSPEWPALRAANHIQLRPFGTRALAAVG
jgi:chitin disaccharide deacetylase